VIVEQVSDTEVRIRKAALIPEEEVRFAEEMRTPLSDRDHDQFLDMLDNPPEPTDALRRAFAQSWQARGKVNDRTTVRPGLRLRSVIKFPKGADFQVFPFRERPDLVKCGGEESASSCLEKGWQ
jgi:hypothetical protein